MLFVSFAWTKQVTCSHWLSWLGRNSKTCTGYGSSWWSWVLTGYCCHKETTQRGLHSPRNCKWRVYGIIDSISYADLDKWQGAFLVGLVRLHVKKWVMAKDLVQNREGGRGSSPIAIMCVSLHVDMQWRTNDNISSSIVNVSMRIELMWSALNLTTTMALLRNLKHEESNIHNNTQL